MGKCEKGHLEHEIMNRPHIIPYCGKEKPASHNAQTVAKGTDRKYKKWKNDFVRNAYREKEEYREKHIGNHRTINGLSHPSKNMALPHIQKKKSGKRDSNSRPLAWEANALPTELLPH